MIDPITIKSIFKKDAKTICIYIGGFYTIFGLSALLIENLHASALLPEENGSSVQFDSLHHIWALYMPLMAILGILYLLFGFIIDKVLEYISQIELILRILSLCWVLAYTITCLFNIEFLLADMDGDLGIEKYIAYVFALFGFAATLALFTLPQYIIHKKIKTQRASGI